ncbi:4-hydroxy-tetrahydrodipicolinate reductase [Halomarina ordinaria]|uniref:4-hydroxy-tetrahydrodipicolinate reductase n=1 Tax=Halomarina ordinaria TaxID=3033939 RepID=A0ABD5U7Q5_9EURY|nr:4-hydroxy-tetrahydrodipicolinate reductase [Halomarina sp. PSRA2]
MRVCVTGATGRMGDAVRAGATERGWDVLPVSRTAEDARSPADLASVLADERPDALVDFTVPESSVEAVAACAEAGVPAVVGTTGFDDAETEALHEASEAVPVLHAPNFARGVATLAALVEEASETLVGYDVELTETHHRGKRDAPSGTANRLLDAVESPRAARGDDTERVHGREGEHLRGEREVGVHVRRAGDIRGEHEVLFAGNDEVLTLTHRAESRGVFAAGALDAAAWLAGREAGWYDFSEVLHDDA